MDLETAFRTLAVIIVVIIVLIVLAIAVETAHAPMWDGVTFGNWLI